MADLNKVDNHLTSGRSESVERKKEETKKSEETKIKYIQNK